MDPILKTLSVREVATLCGVNRNTVGYWCRSGKFHAHRVGKKYLIPIKDLRLFLESSGRAVPEGLHLENPLARIFKTIEPCWDYFQETPHGNGCKDCRIFQKRLGVCFINRGFRIPNCSGDCYECTYFRDIYLPRIQMVHQIAIPAFIYKDFHFWGGNEGGAELCGLEVDEILGMGVEKLIHRDSLGFMLHEFRMLGLNKLESFNTFTIYFKNRNRDKIEVKAIFSPLHDPEGAWLVLANRKKKSLQGRVQ
jgi:excisionase family DNA binding protein